MLVPDKEFLDHNVQLSIFHHRLLKPSTIESYRRNGHINTLTFRNLIASANDYLSYLRFFLNCDDPTMDYILVNSEATNLMDGTGKSRSGNYIASKNCTIASDSSRRGKR